MALMRRPEHRRFTYEPRYYKPELDKDERRRRRMQFHRRHLLQKRSKSALYWIIIFSLLVYLYGFLSGWFS